jgi:hypothetical protein
VRINLRGIFVLSVNEVAETWKVPSEAAKWLLKLRERIGWVTAYSAHRYAYPPTFFLFIPPTVSFETNNQFIKVFYRIKLPGRARPEAASAAPSHHINARIRHESQSNRARMLLLRKPLTSDSRQNLTSRK